MRIISKSEKSQLGLFPNNSVFTEDNTQDAIITFGDTTKNVCVSVVDIVGSTRVAARLSGSKISQYYGLFLNTLGAIITKYQGKIVKNGGDSILYYFENDQTESMFVRCLECNLTILQIHDYLNMKLKGQGLPQLDYRISSDYGIVALAKTPFMTEDIFGHPVNVCAKINSMAQPNTLVIGSDLYEVAKGLDCYTFEDLSSFSSGLKTSYPVYRAAHNDAKIKTTVAKCIEKMLLSISVPDFEEVVKRLYNKYDCFLFDCYDKPECLKQVLRELYGDAGRDITKNIQSQIEEQLLPRQVKEFLIYLKQ